MSYTKRKLPRVKLAAVKKSLYNPYLPTFRAAEMDSSLGKLHDEHCKTTVPEGVANMPREILYQYHPPQHYVSGFDILPEYHKSLMESSEMKRLSFLENRHLASKWEEFKRGLPLADKRIVNLPISRNFHFKNCYVQYLNTDASSSWRMHLKPGPGLDGQTQLPIPADHQQCYRLV
uniref:Uncharacterized protein n=1 Tax=Timema poppense TaxID=170557 RepID=A0A7R9H3C8_TIMPO|nr:unnamed protein product [Timema poppensis]